MLTAVGVLVVYRLLFNVDFVMRRLDTVQTANLSTWNLTVWHTVIIFAVRFIVLLPHWLWSFSINQSIFICIRFYLFLFCFLFLFTCISFSHPAIPCVWVEL